MARAFAAINALVCGTTALCIWIVAIPLSITLAILMVVETHAVRTVNNFIKGE
jgi:hypothetical protein